MVKMQKNDTQRRANISESVLVRLWAAAGGRCEFPGCNKPVWYDGLTLKDLNVSNIAHIVPHSGDWRRGGDPERSKLLETDFDNLMLLCLECHKRVDDRTLWVDYPEPRLGQMKADHEERIERLLDIDPNRKTHVVNFRDNIGPNTAPQGVKLIHSALTTYYPATRHPIDIDLSRADLGPQDEGYFERAKREISSQIARKIRYIARPDEAGHLSVFALARQSLLVYLGHELGQLTALDVYDFHRDKGSWAWKPYAGEDCEFPLEHRVVGSGGKFVALNVSISDLVQWEDIVSVLPESYHTYTLRVAHPRPGYLATKEQLNSVTDVVRELITDIKSAHGSTCEVHLFPAMPASACIRLGQVWDRKCHPALYVYELDKTLESEERKGFFRALSLCE